MQYGRPVAVAEPTQASQLPATAAATVAQRSLDKDEEGPPQPTSPTGYDP